VGAINAPQGANWGPEACDRSHSAPFSDILKQFHQSFLKRAATELSTDHVMRHNHMFL
jgi:hypothetical protein